MADLFKSNENEFYIQLKEERFYIPGEDISGDVILDLQKTTKTNSIKVTLEGTVTIGGRSLTICTNSILIAESLDGQKSHYLEAHTHRFPFRITIPSAKTHKMPSTLEIPKLLKVDYRLSAIHKKAYTLEKFCPTTSVSMNILEDINVEKSEFSGEQKLERELLLTNENERPVKVTAIIGKRAAVKGDVIPISIKIEHIGVMARDKAISAQLLRLVYYGKNKSEMVGPKVLREATADIIILGPTDFTETFNVKLPIPPNICPTVADSGEAFKIEYFLRLLVNLNEENPLYQESEKDIVIFNAPFVIGTYPKLSFNIDDDEDEVEEQGDAKNGEITEEITEDINPAEVNQVTEKIKDMELDGEAATVKAPSPTIVEMQQQLELADSIATSETTLVLKPVASSPSSSRPIVLTEVQKGENAVNNTSLDSPSGGESKSNSASFKINGTYPSNTHIIISPTSPPLPPSPSLIQRQDSNASSLQRTSTTSSTNSVGLGKQDSVNHLNNNSSEMANLHRVDREESVRWVMSPEEKQGEPIPTFIPSPSPQNMPAVNHNQMHSFVMPTPVSSIPLSNCASDHYFTPQNDSYMSYPAPPSLPVPQQQYSTPPFNNYPPPQYYNGFPTPQQDFMYPPPPPRPDNGYMNMPSQFGYQNQPPYPYYNN